MLGNFTSPASFSMTLSPTVFTATGLSLSTSSTYWIVLKAISGDFNWAWTTDNTGTGTGFQHTWALSDNAGEPGSLPILFRASLLYLQTHRAQAP